MTDTVVLPKTDAGNDPNDWRDDPDAVKQFEAAVDEGVKKERDIRSGGAFPLKPMSEVLASMKGADYLVPPLLERGTLTTLYGDSDTYKSFLLIDLLCCVATGKPFHGRSVKQGPVVLLVGEGLSGIARRVEVWRILNKAPKDMPVLVSEIPAELMDESGTNSPKSVADAIETNCMDRWGELPVAVGVDTLSANLGDGDVTSNSDMAKVIRRINVEFRDRFDCAVLMLAHVGHADKNRELGAYALRGNVDARMLVKRTSGGMSLHSEKVKDGVKFAPIQFRTCLMVIPNLFDSEDEAQTSLVLEEVDYKPDEKPAAEFLSGKKKELHDCLKTMQRDGDVTRKALLGALLKSNVFANSNTFGNKFREMIATGHLKEVDGFVIAVEV